MLIDIAGSAGVWVVRDAVRARLARWRWTRRGADAERRPPASVPADAWWGTRCWSVRLAGLDRAVGPGCGGWAMKRPHRPLGRLLLRCFRRLAPSYGDELLDLLSDVSLTPRVLLDVASSGFALRHRRPARLQGDTS